MTEQDQANQRVLAAIINTIDGTIHSTNTDLGNIIKYRESIQGLNAGLGNGKFSLIEFPRVNNIIPVSYYCDKFRIDNESTKLQLRIWALEAEIEGKVRHLDASKNHLNLLFDTKNDIQEQFDDIRKQTLLLVLLDSEASKVQELISGAEAEIQTRKNSITRYQSQLNAN